MEWIAAEQTAFLVIKVACGIIVAGLSADRAAKMDGRARRAAAWIVAGLALSGAGLALSPLMHRWIAQLFYALFLLSTTGMVLDGQARWRGGMPDDVLKESERWPRKDRRSGADRRTPPGG